MAIYGLLLIGIFIASFIFGWKGALVAILLAIVISILALIPVFKNAGKLYKDTKKEQ